MHRKTGVGRFGYGAMSALHARMPQRP